MNFDPYDSVAWRTFNMLDPEESALFDKARHEDPILHGACLEMDRLSAAIAATVALPIQTTARQLERIQSRLDLNRWSNIHFWLALPGWATAAVLAVILTLQLSGIIDARRPAATAASETAPPSRSHPLSNENQRPLSNQVDGDPTDGSQARSEEDGTSAALGESKRLKQEIEVLRTSLENFQSRDRVLFEALPGMALPIVMAMTPPGITTENPEFFTKTDENSPLTTLLGDALTAMTGSTIDPASSQTSQTFLLPKQPSAIPIYDTARDTGTLVVNKLPPAATGESYHLWVTTQPGGQPIYVGSLPESSASGADSFDFSLGSTLVIPSGFVLTRDSQDSPEDPSANNTILLGPPTPAR